MFESIQLLAGRRARGALAAAIVAATVSAATLIGWVTAPV